jgi:hypothetical protein
MIDTTYNGWTNRETWLVNVWGNPESRADVQALRESLQDQHDELPNGILKDMLDLRAINWEELESHFEDDEDEETDEDDDEEPEEGEEN